jgi:hypothetical protein
LPVLQGHSRCRNQFTGTVMASAPDRDQSSPEPEKDDTREGPGFPAARSHQDRPLAASIWIETIVLSGHERRQRGAAGVLGLPGLAGVVRDKFNAIRSARWYHHNPMRPFLYDGHMGTGHLDRKTASQRFHILEF